MSGPTPEQPFSPDPEHARIQRRRSWKVVLQALRATAQRTDQQIAERIGVGKSQWRRALDQGEGDALHIHDVEALPAEMARGVVERLAALFGLEVREPAPAAQDDTRGGLARFAKLHSEVHDVLRVYLEAVQKGALLGDAASRLIREIDEAIRELQALRAIAEKAAQIRALPVENRSDTTKDARATR